MVKESLIPSAAHMKWSSGHLQAVKQGGNWDHEIDRSIEHIYDVA